jgi:hypothetical protein
LLPLYYTQIWVPSNPRGAERLPPGFVVAESDYYLRRLWGDPKEVSILQPLFLCDIQPLAPSYATCNFLVHTRLA